MKVWPISKFSSRGHWAAVSRLRILDLHTSAASLGDHSPPLEYWFASVKPKPRMWFPNSSPYSWHRHLICTLVKGHNTPLVVEDQGRGQQDPPNVSFLLPQITSLSRPHSFLKLWVLTKWVLSSLTTTRHQSRQSP